MEKSKSNRIAAALAISILSASVYSSNEGAVQSPASSNSSFTSNIDIDGNEEFDALTDGLLILRSMFGLTDSPLITGAVAGDALYVDAEDIQSRIEGLGNRLDIDNDGNIDALTDGLVTLRYLFGLTGDPLISGVIATGADRFTAEDIEAYMAVLTSLDTEPPVFTSQETFTAAENQTAIGTVTATDANSPSITFSISGSELSITSDGVLSFAAAPDYETKTSYTATVTASDGTNLTTQDIVVSVSDVDEAPIMGVLNYTADENQTSIGSVVATDPEGEAVSLSVSGSELLITSDGVLTFASAPDYETKFSYTATVTATDGTNSTDQSVTVTVTDVDDVAPVFASSATFSAAENQTAIDTVTVTDVDTDNSVITFSVSGSELLITSAGVLTFASAPDYETKTSYTAIVTATDGTNSADQSITVNVTNLNDNSPVFTSNATFSTAENQTSIGTVTATDGDASDSVTFTVSGSELSITSAGVLTFVSAPDYETKSSYTATVTATDGTNSTDQSIAVSVNDVNEAPAFTSLATFSADEKQTSIGTVKATDIENDTLTYSVTGTDASAVTVDSSTGVLTFNAGPDYETQSSYSVTAEVSDGSLSTTQAITISINETEFEVYGTAYASKYFVMDGDIPNTDYIANDNSNNNLSGAQSILNPTVVSGYTGHAGDIYDLFIVSTSSNMYVNLDVVDYLSGTKDLDIYIYNSDGSERDFSYVSGSTEGNETINLPNGGTYVIQVYPVAGSSPYLLTVGQRLTSSQASTGHGDFSPNEILSYIPFTPRLTQSSRAEHIARLSTPEIKKRVSDLKLPKTVLEHTPALRKIGSEFLINKFKKQLDPDLNPVLKMSDKQKIYLSHWKAMQRLEEINPMANYELNYTVERMANFSADPLYNYQWNLRQINLEAALNAVGQEVKDVAVAVIDTGSPSVNSDAWNATDFIAGGYDFVASTSNGDGNGIDNDPTDPDASDATLVSHGVHVATTIGMKNDGAGFNGLAVKVLPLRVFPTKAIDRGAYRYDIQQAILYAAGLPNESGVIAPTATPVKVINLSLGGPSAWDCGIFADVAAQGITVVAASGNDGNETPGVYNYPASCTNVVSVGATDSLDQRASYSQYNDMVDVAAPGGSEIDSDADSQPDYVPAWGNNTEFAGLPGTSMASPHVAGAIALMYAIDNNMSPSTVNSYLQAGYLTDDIGASGYDTSFGYGRLNVAKAIENTLSNIGDTTTTFFSSDASYLNFGDSTTQLSITLSKVGNASLSVTSLSADDASGLSYSSSVDSNGAGTYTIYIDRSEVPNGAFQNRLYFNLSNSSQVSLSVYYQVGGARSRANMGKVFIGLYNSDDSLAASGSLTMDGSLSFVANDIVDGEYYFLVSSNNDDDGYVCDYGEFCARYPDTEGAQTFTVSGSDLSGGEIYLDPIFRFGGINAASNMSQPSYNLDIAQPAGSASQSIFKVEALDSDGSEDETNTTIPEGAIPISPN
ncbi:S8 family serine peptidase [Gammaproteobacteria bacterium]|nr:S8 family serine peptidase [Gammaproteobacteria bacterium]